MTRPGLHLRLRIRLRFALVLGMLMGGTLLLGLVSLQGLHDLRESNRALRASVQETAIDGRTRAELMDFKGKLQLYVTTNSRKQRRELRGEIEERIVEVEQGFATMRQRYVDRPDLMALMIAQERPYRALLTIWRSGDGELLGASRGVERRKAALIREIRREVKPMAVAAQQLADRDVDLSNVAAEAADAGFERMRLVVLTALVTIIGTGLLLAGWLVNSIVPRTRRYVEFAGDVSAGHLSTRIDVQGDDELADLGHTLNTMVAQREAEQEYEETQTELTDALQVAADEAEAHRILKLHLERYVPDSDVVILNRNNSADRLESKTALAEDSLLAGNLHGAAPRDCLAVRFVRGQVNGGAGRPPLLGCDLCGGVPGTSTCNPLTVGGEVIGSVLLNTPAPLDEAGHQRLKASLVQAAPVLGNLRNLAISEQRAATDSLTGLPNNRSVRDTVKRMTAQASRSAQTMGAALLDLDHFKQINDTYGHGAGDDVLAAVGAVLRRTIRQSDFVGRAGGEEFVLLFPDSSSEGVRVACEKIRTAIAQIEVPGVDREITASIGFALIPDHAGGADDVLRAADRALYSAKEAGRNRVMVAAAAGASATGEPAAPTAT